VCTDDDQIRSYLLRERDNLGPTPTRQRDVYNIPSFIDVCSRFRRRFSSVVVGVDNIQKRYTRAARKRERVRVFISRSRVGRRIDTAHDFCKARGIIGQ
jgi:hypothetical protein